MRRASCGASASAPTSAVERPPDNEISAWLSNGKRCPDPLWTSVNGKWAHPYVASGYLQLLEEVRLVRPNVIIALGNAAMWALTGKWGIKSWRGSLLTTPTGVKVLPAYHPAYILRDWAQRTITIHDLKRAEAQASSPLVPSTDYFFVIRPSYSAVAEFLAGIEAQLAKGPTTIAVDIETRAGHLACLGLALDTRRALCIPFMCTEREDGYWNVDEEVAIICVSSKLSSVTKTLESLDRISSTMRSTYIATGALSPLRSRYYARASRLLCGDAERPRLPLAQCTVKIMSTGRTRAKRGTRTPAKTALGLQLQRRRHHLLSATLRSSHC